jgi:hypothetical protein
MGSEGSVFSQVKNFLAEAGQAAGESPAKVTAVVGPLVVPSEIGLVFGVPGADISCP